MKNNSESIISSGLCLSASNIALCSAWIQQVLSVTLKSYDFLSQVHLLWDSKSLAGESNHCPIIFQSFTITHPHFALSQVACFATSAASKKYCSYCFHSISEKVFMCFCWEIKYLPNGEGDPKGGGVTPSVSLRSPAPRWGAIPITLPIDRDGAPPREQFFCYVDKSPPNPLLNPSPDFIGISPYQGRKRGGTPPWQRGSLPEFSGRGGICQSSVKKKLIHFKGIIFF